jgi:hypothetical protein
MLCIGLRDEDMIEVIHNGETLRIVVTGIHRGNTRRLGFDGPRTFQVNRVVGVSKQFLDGRSYGYQKPENRKDYNTQIDDIGNA